MRYSKLIQSCKQAMLVPPIYCQTASVSLWHALNAWSSTSGCHAGTQAYDERVNAA